jgi:hypothetical protein
VYAADARAQVFLKDMNDFVTVNGIYAKFFGEHKPARSAVEVARLPKDVLFEIEAIVRSVHVPSDRRMLIDVRQLEMNEFVLGGRWSVGDGCVLCA